MKKKSMLICATVMLAGSVYCQVEIDKSIDLIGPDGVRIIRYLEAPLEDTDAVNKAYVDAAVSAGGGGGSSLPTMLSDESSTTMTFGDAMRYCRNLEENEHTDWHMPSFAELTYIVSKGGTTIPSEDSVNNVWLADRPGTSSASSNQTHLSFIRLSDGSIGAQAAFNLNLARCVR
jgi:hypothetical protein